jgi:hypothetical protein
MIAMALDSALLSGGLAQFAQPLGTYDSKTDQTAQTDQRIEIPGQFVATPGSKPTSRHSKLTSGTAQQPNPCLQIIGAPLASTPARPSEGAPHS